jgi:hypothetical protein
MLERKSEGDSLGVWTATVVMGGYGELLEPLELLGRAAKAAKA